MDPVEVVFTPVIVGTQPDVIEINLDEPVDNNAPPARRGYYGWNCCDDVISCMSDTAHSVAAHVDAFCRHSVAVMDEVADILCDCAEEVTEPIRAAYRCVNETFAETGRAVGRGYAWLDREVVQLSHEHLSPELAELTIRAFRGVPFAAAYLVLPAPVVGIGCGALFISSWLGHRPFSDATYRRLYDGWGMGVSIRLGVDTVNFLATGSPAFAIAATINLITAAWLFNKASSYQ